MDISQALDMLTVDRVALQRTYSEQMSTDTFVRSLKTMTDVTAYSEIRANFEKRLGPNTKLIFFGCSLQPVSLFFDTVLVMAACNPDMQDGLPELLEALITSKCFNMCKRLAIDIDTLSSAAAAANDDDRLIEVWGRGLVTFRLRSRLEFRDEAIPNWNGLIFCIQGLEMARHTLRNLTLTRVGLGFTESTDIFDMLCDKVIKNNFVLSMLDLSNNFLRDEHVSILLSALETCPSLTCLDLADNNITSQGVSDIERRCRQLVELNLGTVKGFAGVLPQAVLTMNLNTFHYPRKNGLLTLIQNPEGERENPIENLSAFNMGVLLADMPSASQLAQITEAVVIMYDDDKAKTFSKSLLSTPSMRQLFPRLSSVRVFGCDSMEMLNWTPEPTASIQSCLRQDNTHIVLDDTNHTSCLLNIILAGASLPFGEEAFKDDTAVDKLFNFDVIQYNSFWADQGLRFTDSTANPDNQDQVFTTTVTLLATNPAPGQHRFVLKNKVKLFLHLYQEDRPNEGCGDRLPYRGHVHVKFLKPSRAETSVFATTTDTQVNKLLQHVLLSPHLKQELKRAGLALKSCCHWD